MKSERPLSSRSTTASRPPAAYAPAADLVVPRAARGKAWLEAWLEAEEDDIHNQPCTD